MQRFIYIYICSTVLSYGTSYHVLLLICTGNHISDQKFNLMIVKNQKIFSDNKQSFRLPLFLIKCNFSSYLKTVILIGLWFANYS